jgi:hypothetical protein
VSDLGQTWVGLGADLGRTRGGLGSDSGQTQVGLGCRTRVSDSGLAWVGLWALNFGHRLLAGLGAFLVNVGLGFLLIK